MTDAEKIQDLINRAQILLAKQVTSSDQDFYAWRLEAEDFLKSKFGSEAEAYTRLHARYFSPMVLTSWQSEYERQASSIEACAEDLMDTITELKFYLKKEKDNEQERIQQTKTGNMTANNKVFLVHGHDGELKSEVARMLDRQGIDTVILSEQANQGRTIIEKIEHSSDVGAAIILLTADDLGKEKNESDEKPRARQNVIFEAGYFMGKLGRERVIVIAEQNIEIPSDLQGFAYTGKGNWINEVLRELKFIGYKIDVNKLIGQ